MQAASKCEVHSNLLASLQSEQRDEYFISILSLAAAAVLSNLAMASAFAPSQDFAGTRIMANAPQQAFVATKTAMGPTSAPQKPGGTGQDSQQTPKFQKKTKHNYSAS
jgi:hypothetical protein